MTREELAAKMAELRKLTPEEREARQAERRNAHNAAHEATLAEARLAIEAAEEEYGIGRTKLLDGDGGTLVLRIPTRNERRLFRNVARSEKANEGAKREAEERLVRDCLLWPELAVYERQVEACPRLAEAAALAAVTMGDAAEVDEAGK